MTPVIRVSDLSKHYHRVSNRRRFATLKSALLGGGLFGDPNGAATFPALSDVSFAVRRGSMVAIVGPNGSGKSTLLKILAGILQPTRGTVEVDGRVAALLELGAGFHPEISGRENIVINGIMLGLSRREIEARIPEIIRFAELEEFIDAPVKTYSSGMYVRLGFSVAVAVEPDVLIVDEVLAVGDEAFSHKCIDRFRDLKRRGRTVLLVTHSLDLAEQMAEEIILLESGRITAIGQPREVIDRYRGHVAAAEANAAAAGDLARVAAGDPESATADGEPAAEVSDGPDPEHDSWRPRRWGNRLIEISQVELCAADGAPSRLFPTGQPMTIELQVTTAEPQTDFVFGIGIWTRSGTLAYGTNTEIERFRPTRIAGNGRVRFQVPALHLIEGTYSLDVAVHTRDGLAFDYRRACSSFVVSSPVKDQGVARLVHRWQFEGGIELAAVEQPGHSDE